jgi:uncharacterized membrane protein
MSTSQHEPGAPLPSLELWNDDIAHLRKSAGWARFIAVVGFAVAGLMLFGSAGFLLKQGRIPARGAVNVMTFAATVASYVAAAALIWSYARSLVAFVRNGERSLEQAFRRLRLFFQLWTVFVALDTAWTILSLFVKVDR